MGTRLETYIHSLNNPKKDLAVVDSPNMPKEFAALCHTFTNVLWQDNV
jgi:hypothetical protein